ncbi:MAG: isoprenylcysteine carboxylmethyltransferase family protein [Bacteroidia bacterium]|nr:isoprenylcysteine carboxylmethyltransferase family protein [Bacteroidia bacterium]
MKAGNSHMRTTGWVLVVLQFALLLAMIVHAPYLPAGVWLYVFGLGVLLGLWAVIVIPPLYLRIHPEPATDAMLIRRGPYRMIRHPMYAALLLVGISWASDHPSFSRWMLYIMLLLVLVTKIKLEERILSNRFAAYQEYQRSSWKLVPFIW